MSNNKQQTSVTPTNAKPRTREEWAALLDQLTPRDLALIRRFAIVVSTKR